MQDLGNMVVGLVVVAWLGSGYLGAAWLMGKGYILEFAGCAILAGGLPVLLPAVVGPFFLLAAILLPAKEHSVAGRLKKPKESDTRLDINVPPPVIEVPPPIIEVKPVIAPPSPARSNAPRESNKCPQCGHTVRPEAGFCPGCGQTITPAAASDNPRFCANCGSPMRSQAKFCAACGSSQQ